MPFADHYLICLFADYHIISLLMIEILKGGGGGEMYLINQHINTQKTVTSLRRLPCYQFSAFNFTYYLYQSVSIFFY